MDFPKGVKIGGHLVRLKLVSSKELDGDRTAGTFDSARNLILIDKDMPESQQECILLHEIVEWIGSTLELGLEHRQVSALAESLFQVLRDNDLDFKQPKEMNLSG
jgi:hypothetical protein